MPRATIEKSKPAAQTAPIAPEPAGEIKPLSLADISIDPNVSVRTGPEAKDEPEQIDALARAIYEQGQLAPVLVRPNGNGGYKLIAGHRRLKAIALIEEKTSAPWKVLAIVVDKTDDEAWDAAFAENFRRRNFSPIELAHNIITLKARKGWEGEDWTRHASEYLRVSRATISQHVKLLNLSDRIQAKIHAGVVSAQAAFDLVAVEEQRGKAGSGPSADEVLEKAEERAESDEKKSRVGEARDGKIIESRPQSARAMAIPQAVAKGGDREKGKIKRKHVLAAAREAEAVQNKARTRGEILTFFEELTGPVSPEPMAKFASAFVDKWVTGTLSDKALLSRWYAIAELVEAGSKKAAKKAVKK